MEQYDRAIEQFRKTLELDPKYFWAHMLIGVAHIATGKLDEGIHICETTVKLAGRGTPLLGNIGSSYAWAGRTSEAKKILDELYQLAQITYVPPTSFAYVYSGMGEIDNAFDWLDKAVDEQDGMIINFTSWPFFSDRLRTHPRF